MPKPKASIPLHSYLGVARHPILDRLPKYFWQYLVLIVVSIVIRFVGLGWLPTALTHDEVYYANQARALAVAGTDQTETWSPWSLTSAHPLFAEWPGLTMTPLTWLFFNDPIFAARASYAAVGVILPLLLAGITVTLFGKRKLGLVVAVVATISPWWFQQSRQMFDISFTLFFFLSGMYLLLCPRWWLKLLAVVPLFVGFFQYQGGKVLLLPMILLVMGYQLYQTWKIEHKVERASLAVFSVVLVVAVGLVGWFWQGLSSQAAGSRTGDLIFSDKKALTEAVAVQRLGSIATPLTRFHINKGTVLVSNLLSNAVRSLDLQQFFVKGEPIRNPTSSWSHGLYYGVDAVMLIAGIVLVLSDRRWRAQGALVVALLVLGVLPQALNNKDVWIYHRLGLFTAMSFILIAISIYSIWQQRTNSRLLRGGLVAIYSLSALYFGYIYLFQAPVLQTTDKYFAERVLANYVKRLQPKTNTSIVVLADESRFVFEEIALYNGYINPQDFSRVSQAFADDTFWYSTLTVDTECFTQNMLDTSVVITSPSVVRCENDPIPLDTELDAKLRSVIRSPYSGEHRFEISNDLLCQGTAAATLPQLTWKTLRLEELSDQEFCSTYIVTDRD